MLNAVTVCILVEALAGLRHSATPCGGHQAKDYLEMPDISAADCCLLLTHAHPVYHTADEGSELP